MAELTKANQLVIGLTGPVGSGVTTVGEILESNGFQRRRLSTKIKEELARREQVGSPAPSMLPAESPAKHKDRLQEIGNEFRRSSPTHWLDLALADVNDSEPIVIEGIKNVNEIEGLRQAYRNSFIIAVMTTRDVRWARVKTDFNGAEGEFDRVDYRDSDEETPHGQQVVKCVLEADLVFPNEEPFGYSETRKQRLFSKLNPDLKLMRGEERRDPTDQEVHMATAYAQSYSSRCLKRYVGAVIVKDGFPVSLGYNENPSGMLPCVQKYAGRCFKDDDMHTRLELQQGVHCPKCGTRQERLKAPWLCTKSDCRENLKMRLFPSRNMERCTAIHAEERAILGLQGRTAEGATMYVTTFPCFQCARYIVEAKIRKVVFVEPYPVKESRKFLEENGVSVLPFEGFKARAFSRVFKPRE